MEALIFNIQKFSLHDGPGIRTVVFFKGCPLRCAWCANPESQRMAVQPMRDGDKRELSGARRTLADLLHICMQDEPFYRQSGGGVTLSGGEPLMQPDFAAALLNVLRERGVHTAIETTGHAAPEVFERVCARADLLLYDVKHWDERRHIEGTGVGTALIHANLGRAIAGGLNVLPRIPVIPGYNDQPSDARAMATLLRQMGANRVQLLPFHQLGERKYEMLGMDYAYAQAVALDERQLKGYQNVFIEGGIEAFF